MTWMPHRRSFLAGALGLAALPLAAHAAPGPLVFAAASLKSALDRAATLWEAAGRPRPLVSYAGTPTHARHIAHGAPADLFIAANAAWMDDLAARARLVAGTRRNWLSNRLVLVAPRDRARPLDLTAERVQTRLGGGRLAIGHTRAVPAGIYGAAALRALGLWPGVSGRLAETDSVRAALALAARGEVPLALVYASDAKASDAVTTVAMFPAESHPAIQYPAAQIAGSRHKDAAALLAWLSSDAAWPAFATAGFLRADGHAA